MQAGELRFRGNGSGGGVVFVDHAAEYSVASDRSGDWDGGWLVVVGGGELVSGLVGSMTVVVLRVLRQDLGGVMVVIDQDVVGALGADGADEPLGVTVRSGGSAVVSW
jgi:hypothetical protein